MKRNEAYRVEWERRRFQDENPFGQQETQVLIGIYTHETTIQTAKRSGLKPTTVRTYKNTIYAKILDRQRCSEEELL